MLCEPTLFRKYYERGDLPVAVSFNGALRKVLIHQIQLTWKMEPEHLDYHLHLPIFFEGIREVEEPYKFLAVQGTDELIERNPGKLLPVLPQLIIPIKSTIDLNLRGPFDQRPRSDVHCSEENPEVSSGRRYDRRSLGALL